MVGSRLVRYRASGRTTLLFVGLMALVAALAVLVAWPYQAIARWMPLIYGNLALYAGVVVGMMMAIEFAADLGKNRSRVAGVLAAVAVAGAFVVASHYWTYRALLDDVSAAVAEESGLDRAEVRAKIAEEVSFTKHLELRAATGWSIGRRGSSGARLDGGFVWAVWSLEALGLLAAAVLAGGRSRPFCERCQHPMTEAQLFTCPTPPLEALSAIERAADTEALWAARTDDDLNAPVDALAYQVTRCETCDGPWYLTITRTWIGDPSSPTKNEAVLQAMVEVPADEVRRHTAEFVEFARARGVIVPMV